MTRLLCFLFVLADHARLCFKIDIGCREKGICMHLATLFYVVQAALMM